MRTYPLFDKNYFTIKGLPFLTEDHYHRFPKAMMEKIESQNKSLPWLGEHLSGGIIFFETDAKHLHMTIEYAYEPLMNHMAPSGESGFDLYIKNDDQWIFYDVIRPFPRQKMVDVNMQLPNKSSNTLMMYTPLYTKILKANVMIEDHESIHPYDPKLNQTIFFYGTSITQGACASRPGLSFTNQVSRMLNIEVINMGFSGNGLGEPSIAQITHLCPHLAMIVIDYDANAGAVGKIEDTLIPWIEIVRQKHQEIPILILSRIPFNREIFDENDRIHRMKNKNYQKMVASQHRNIHFIDGEWLIHENETEVTVDGIHLNDLGMTLFAQRLAPYIAAHLKR